MAASGKGEVKAISMHLKRIIPIFFIVLFFISCASIKQADRKEKKIDIKEQMAAVDNGSVKSSGSGVSEPKIPEFVPANEDTSPLQTKTVSLAARNTPLREVLFTVAETANLNLVLERGVDTEIQVTMTLKNMRIEDALDAILNSVDYFYSVKENILAVKALDTKIFELGHPNVIQEYKLNVGGNILGGTSSVGSGSSAITGDVSMSSASDTTSFQFWEAVEKTLEKMFRQEESKGPQPIFVVNRMAGTIMITATKKDLERAGNYIANLKRVLNRQVVIEARVVEVQLSEGLKYGIDWSSVMKGIGMGATYNLSTVKFTDVFSSDSPAFQFSITDNDGLGLLLSALQEQGNVKTLSNPRINILNGQAALLSVGRSTNFISKVQTTTTTTSGSAPTTTYTVETNSVLSGVLFGLLPFISNEGEITLTITPIVTTLVSLESKTIGAAGNQVEIKLPTVDLREMSTTVKVADGQIIVIGGLISKTEKQKENKVPILGNLPVVGELFKSVDNLEEQTELVIMLIPRLAS